MALPVQTSRVLQFGTFQVDLRAGELRKSGTRIKLQEQPFQVLKMLLERPGDILTREELRQKLWPADTFVDFEAGLNTAIRKLRGRKPRGGNAWNIPCARPAIPCGQIP